MEKYVCTICGYVYDSSSGSPETGVSSQTPWHEVPDSWLCPICNATKSQFKEPNINSNSALLLLPETEHEKETLRELNSCELSALFSGLALGSIKQDRLEESILFQELSDYYKTKISLPVEPQWTKLNSLIHYDLEEIYEKAFAIATKYNDRGSLRALTWSEKVTRMNASILQRFLSGELDKMEHLKIYICDVCGFLYLGDEKPVLCPVCKAPPQRILEVHKEVAKCMQ